MATDMIPEPNPALTLEECTRSGQHGALIAARIYHHHADDQVRMGYDRDLRMGYDRDHEYEGDDMDELEAASAILERVKEGNGGH